MSHGVLLVVLQGRSRCGAGSRHGLAERRRRVRALLACEMTDVSKRRDISGKEDMGRMSREARDRVSAGGSGEGPVLTREGGSGGEVRWEVLLLVLLMLMMLLLVLLHEAIVEVWRRRSRVG